MTWAKVKKTIRAATLTILPILWICPAIAQDSKSVTHQFHFWTSINTTISVKNNWGLMADYHHRRNDYGRSSSFDFARLGFNYWLDNNLTATVGYAHLWLAPTTDGWGTYSNENRLFLQVQHQPQISPCVNMLHRFRAEYRKQQKIQDDVYTGEFRYTARFRYLLNFTVPVFSDPRLPRLVVADEILMHIGKEVVHTPLDQNRIFLGLRQQVTADLSFDIGYMAVYQQKYSGHQYDLNHTLRLFFYYLPDFRKKD